MPLTDLGTWHRCRSLIARHVPGCCLLTVTAVPIACMRHRPVLRQYACHASFFAAWTQFQSCRNIPLVHTVVVSRVPAATRLWACTPAPSLRSFAHALWRRKCGSERTGEACVLWVGRSRGIPTAWSSTCMFGRIRCAVRFPCASPACTALHRPARHGRGVVWEDGYS